MRKQLLHVCALALALIALPLFGQDPATAPPSEALLEDAAEYASRVGVGVDEAVRRLRLQRQIGDLEAVLLNEEPATYAGMWIEDTPRYRAVARFTDPAAAGRLRARVAGGALEELIETRSARWSLAELEKRQTESRGLARGLKIQTNSNVNVVENRVELYVLDPAKFGAAIAAAKARIPEGVAIQRVSRLAEPEALIGGSPLTTCTGGFTVQAPTGELGVATAGHCQNTQSFQFINLPFRREKEDGEYDVQWHSGCDLVQVTNQFETGFGLRSVIGTRHRNNQVIGTFVCKFGKTTGKTCGWIDSKTYDPNPISNLFGGKYIYVDGRGANLSEGGDSGGPWFVEDIAYGIHSGHPANDKNSYYMAINYVSGVGVSVLTSNPGACNFVPIANFAAHARLDGFATFNGSTSADPDGFIVRWEWNFDDGTTAVSTTPSITHVYPPDSGSYIVTLTVTDNEGKRGSTAKEVCVPTIACNVVGPTP